MPVLNFYYQTQQKIVIFLNCIYQQSLRTFLIIFFILISLSMRHVGKKGQESISNFIEKTYNILENQQNSQIVAWTPKGTSFIIKDIKKFQEYILPIYFKHSNFSSFVRQLNMYNFHKVRGDRLDCEFEHEKFKKDQRQLLCKIRRKQSQSFIISQNIIEQAQGNQSMQDSSQNIKKYSQGFINLEFTPKDPSKVDSTQKNQAVLIQLQNLRRENKSLKASKQNKIQKQKMLLTPNIFSTSQKFFKLTTCLLAQKLHRQLKIEQNKTIEVQKQCQKFMNFDLIIQHILSNNQSPMQFSKYSMTAKTISSQQSDYDFMVRKANNIYQNLSYNQPRNGFSNFESI